MRTKLMLTAAIVTCLASGAFADLVRATGGTEGPNTTTFADNVVFDMTKAQFFDGQLALDKSANGAAGNLVLDVFFNPGSPGVGNAGGEARLVITTGNSVANVVVTGFSFYNQTAGFASRADATAFTGGPLAPLTISRFTPTAISIVGGFNIATYNAIRITFNFPNGVGGGDRLSIDAISNPEPGTIALFALGAAGLGGFAWRRRKTAKAPAAKV